MLVHSYNLISFEFSFEVLLACSIPSLCYLLGMFWGADYFFSLSGGKNPLHPSSSTSVFASFPFSSSAAPVYFPLSS